MSVVNPEVVTSRVPSTLRKVYTDLKFLADSNQLPPNPATGEQPAVSLGRLPVDASEWLVVSVNPDESSSEWVQMSPAKRLEEFAIDIQVGMNVPSEVDELDALDRLEGLLDAAQLAWYDVDTGRPVKMTDVLSVTRVGAVDMFLLHADGAWSGGGLVRVFFQALV